MVETRRGKRKENPTKEAKKKKEKARKKVKTKETTRESGTVSDGVISEPINVLMNAAVAVEEEGVDLREDDVPPRERAPTLETRPLEEEEDELENNKEESETEGETSGSDEKENDVEEGADEENESKVVASDEENEVETNACDENSEEESRDGEQEKGHDESLKPEPSNAEKRWFEEHPELCHLFHMKLDANANGNVNKKGSNHKERVWFIVNGVLIRYGLREHTLISCLNCCNYPLGYKEFGDRKFVKRHFKEGELIRLKDVKAKLLAIRPHRDRLKMMVLFFLGSVICAQTKVELWMILNSARPFHGGGGGRYSFDFMVKEISHTMDHFGGLVKEKTLWPLLGFYLPLEISNRTLSHYQLIIIIIVLLTMEASSHDIDNILPTRNDEENDFLADLTEEEDDVYVFDLTEEKDI
ncbi:hypothetical protein N665_0010s0037 [Sinapis alba]|nr:hypothetical protein N665_0010s0037 [Sinapis alba]